MATAFVQTSKNNQASNASSLSTSLSATTAGQTIIVATQYDPSRTIASVVTTGGTGSDTFTITSLAGPAGSTGGDYAIYLLQSCGSGRTGITVTYSGATPYSDIIAWVISGQTGTVVDKSVTASGTGSSVTTASTGTLTSADEFALEYATSSAQINSVNSPWTSDGITSITGSGGGHQVISSTAGVSGNFTNAGGANWFALVATFKSGSSGPSVNITGASASALAGTVTIATSDSVSLTGAGCSALAGTTTVAVGDSASITGASASALAGTATAATSDSATVTGAAAVALAGTATTTISSSATLTGAAVSVLAGTVTGSTSDSVSLIGASASALAGTATTTTADSATLTGAAAAALAGDVSTSAGGNATANLVGASASALAGSPTTSTSDQTAVSGAAAAAQAGTAIPATSEPSTGAACQATAGGLAAAIQKLMTGAMAAALAGAVALTGAVAPDGAQATALAGDVTTQGGGTTAILTGASAAAIAGDVTTSIVVTQLNPNYIARGGARQTVAIGLPRSAVALGMRRNRVIVGISNAMSQTNNLLPPIDETVEVETATFDFGLILAAGVTLTGTPTVTCAVYSGVDSDPASRLSGPAIIVTSPNSAAPSAAVSQLVGAMIAGVTYRLQCVCATSDGQNLSLWTHLSCQAPN